MADAKTPKDAKVTPGQYIQQVRQESRKVIWPSARETYVTSIQVLIMVIIMGAFFFFVDWVLANVIRLVLGIGA